MWLVVDVLIHSHYNITIIDVQSLPPMISIPSTIDKIEPIDSNMVTIKEASTVTYVSPLTMEEIIQCKIIT